MPPPQQVQNAPQPDKLLYTVMAITAFLTVLLIVALLCFAINRATGCAKPNDAHGGNDGLEQGGIPSGTTSAILPETSDMGQSYIDSMIFVGDSNTAHLRSFGVLADGKETKQVWATKSQTISLDPQITSKKIVYPDTGEEMTIAQAASLKKPQYLVISLGTNGLAYLDEEQFKYCYNKLLAAIKEVSPSTKVIIQSIYPVTSWYTGISNAQINEANEWLVELAKEAGVRYIDTASVLKDGNGALKETYNSYHEDGYHINADAYKAILQYIRTHGWA